MQATYFSGLSTFFGYRTRYTNIFTTASSGTPPLHRHAPPWGRCFSRVNPKVSQRLNDEQGNSGKSLGIGMIKDSEERRG
jgi:hypothetical protein